MVRRTGVFPILYQIWQYWNIQNNKNIQKYMKKWYIPKGQIRESVKQEMKIIIHEAKAFNIMGHLKYYFRNVSHKLICDHYY